MVDVKLLNWLHKNKTIDKRRVLWWQLGFEGRRIYSEEEFNSQLVPVSYKEKIRQGPPKEETFLLWPHKNVPILLKEGDIEGRLITYFVSVRPTPQLGEDWDVKSSKETGWPISEYRRPHIRGVVAETTAEFLFWYPFLYRGEEVYYGVVGRKYLAGLPALVSIVHSEHFYRNLIEGGWHKGTRAQKPPIKFGYNKKGFRLVPYYEFNPAEKNIMIYPAPLFEGRLDFPIIIKSNPEEGSPDILGTGYFGNRSAYYWEIDTKQRRLAKKTLIERLGNPTR